MALLPILLMIHTHPFIHAADEHLRAPVNVQEREVVRKIPINLDVSMELPNKIMATKSTQYPGTTHYYLAPEHYDTHRIGAVFDNGTLVFNDSRMNVERCVYFSIKEDGTRVIRTTDKCKTGDGRLVRVAGELKKRPRRNYTRFARHPVDIDVMNPEMTEKIKTHKDESGNVIFTIKEEWKDDAYVGVVKYKYSRVHVIINDDILERVVTLNTNFEHPEVTIRDFMNDGTILSSEYVIVNGKDVVHLKTFVQEAD